MNWDRGLLRLTIILSTVSAIGCGVYCYWDADKSLGYERSELRSLRSGDWYGDKEEQHLIAEWKQAKTHDEQERLWMKWTGRSLEPRTTFAELARRIDEEAVRRGLIDEEDQELSRLIEEEEKELDQLKKKGWQTVKGDPLPMFPEDVWKHIKDIEYRRKVQAWEDQRRQTLFDASVIGILIGFIAVWGVYAAIWCLGWPLCKWVACGFREGKQTDDKKNE